MMKIKSYYDTLPFLVMGVAVFLFLFVGYPQAMNIQEQNQLFLFSTDYFTQRMVVAGGLADWISEFIVQFYYLPWLGALVVALLAVIMQWLISRATALHGVGGNIAAMIPVLTLVGVMGDENVLMSYAVAIIITLAFVVMCRRLKWWCDVVIIPVLYWLAGPMTILYALLRIVHRPKHEWWTILWLVAVEILAYAFVLDEYPLKEVMLGINYYRIPLVLVLPKTLLIVPLTIILLALVGRLEIRFLGYIASIIAVAVAVLSVWLGYPKDKYELFMQDKLVREGQWQKIIDRAGDYQVTNNFSSNCVNLALAMTRQLAEKQFSFYQSGDDALIMPAVRDNLSNWPTAEAFYRLGMVNSAKRYAYDIQESILNGRRSGRAMKRITECLIINGQYDVAKKYIDVLKQSLFYRSWAEDAESCLGNENKIKANKEWTWIRKVRYKDNFLYSFPEIDKMLGLLFINNPENKMALDYFMGDMLLKGEVPQFMHYMGWAQRYGGYSQMPFGYADIMQLMQNNGNVPGSPYMKYIQQQRAKEGGQK